MTESMALARFVADAKFDDLPLAVVERAKRHILDTLGASLAGSASFESRQVAQAMADEGGAGTHPIWGTQLALGRRDAALVNGVAAHALELDDTGGCDHSGAVVLPAVLASLPAHSPVPGRDLILAVVLGYDVGRRVLEACGGYSAHNGQGWHSTATCGVFGAAAAAARLRGLDAQHTAWALGHAASFSGGLWAFIHDASQTKRLHAGRAAEGGVLAVEMAARDISGPAQVFEDVWGGFFNAFAPASVQRAALQEGLGETWKLMRCSIKPHASCRSNHSTIDSVIHLMAANKGLAQRVSGIEVRLSQFVMNMCGGSDLSTLASAQMSMPYAIAVAWVFGDASLERYVHAVRQDKRLAAAMSLVTLTVDPAMADLDEPEVTITSAGHRAVSHRTPAALGAPANPLSDAQLRTKFMQLAQVALAPAQADALASTVMQLERLDDCNDLLALLKGNACEHALIR